MSFCCTLAGAIALFTAGGTVQPRAFALFIAAERGVPARVQHTVAREARYLHGAIGRDLALFPRQLTIRLYATHRSFARALWQRERARPQASTDDSSSIVRNTLLLGPLPPAFLLHNLAHVYTEWLVDQLTGNRTDGIPRETWLYEGLAETEGYRYEPAGMRCSGGDGVSFDVTRIRTAKQWLALRAGPLGAVEYCLAYLQVRKIVASLGWPRIVHVLRTSGAWAPAARRIETASR